MSSNSSTFPIWHHNTTTCSGNRVTNGHCSTCREPASESYTIRVQVDVKGEEFELKRDPDPPWQRDHAMYTPAVKPVVPVWKQRQIMRQQRPRDGLK